MKTELLFMLVLSLVACSQQQPVNERPQQMVAGGVGPQADANKMVLGRLTTAYQAYTAVLQTTTTLLQNNIIGPTEAQHVSQIAQTIRPLLDTAAKQLRDGDNKTATSNIELANKLLLTLQESLHQRGAVK